MRSGSISDETAAVSVEVVKWAEHGREVCRDEVAAEVPVALEYNGISHVVMLASPHDLEDFALGFSLTEEVLSEPAEIYECEVVPTEDGILVRMRISAERFAGLKDMRRNLTGRTGCGLCGVETLKQAIRRPPPVKSDALFSASTLNSGMRIMQSLQLMQRHSGATHAAAWLTPDGTVDMVREDVGRHNALDKLIGALAREGRDLSRGAALITSRASYEMVQKAATVGIGFVAAISAPTSLAVRMALETNLTLVGFVREQRHVVYAGKQRLIPQETGYSKDFKRPRY